MTPLKKLPFFVDICMLLRTGSTRFERCLVGMPIKVQMLKSNLMGPCRSVMPMTPKSVGCSLAKPGRWLNCLFVVGICVVWTDSVLRPLLCCPPSDYGHRRGCG